MDKFRRFSQKLTPMLLNEVQKQQGRIDELQGEIDTLKALPSGKTQ